MAARDQAVFWRFWVYYLGAAWLAAAGLFLSGPAWAKATSAVLSVLMVTVVAPSHVRWRRNGIAACRRELLAAVRNLPQDPHILLNRDEHVLFIIQAKGFRWRREWHIFRLEEDMIADVAEGVEAGSPSFLTAEDFAVRAIHASIFHYTHGGKVVAGPGGDAVIEQDRRPRYRALADVWVYNRMALTGVLHATPAEVRHLITQLQGAESLEAGG